MKSAARGQDGAPEHSSLRLVRKSDVQYYSQRGSGEVLLRSLSDRDRAEARPRGSIDGHRLRSSLISRAGGAIPERRQPSAFGRTQLIQSKEHLAQFEPSLNYRNSPLVLTREITPLPHAVLLDRTIQWMFHKSKFHARPGEQSSQGSYVIVVSASKVTSAEIARRNPGTRDARTR